jgi:hypothetical protein
LCNRQHMVGLAAVEALMGSAGFTVS